MADGSENEADILRERIAELESSVAALHDENVVLHKDNELRDLIINKSHDAFIAIDGTGRVTLWSRRAQEIFGFSEAEATGRMLGDTILPPRFRKAHEAGLRQFLQTGESKILDKRIEISAMHKRGHEFPIILSVFMAGTREDEPQFCAFVEDISQQLRIEQRRASQYGITRVLAESETLEEGAPRLLQTACEAAGWDVGAIWIAEANPERLNCVYLWHGPAVSIDEFEKMTLGMTFGRNEGLPGRVWATGNAVWHEDIVTEDYLPRRDVAIDCNLRGAFAFPILSGDSVLGVVEFFSHEIKPPDGDLLALFTATGSQIGQFIERQRAQRANYQLALDLKNKVLQLESLNAEQHSLSDRLANARDQALAASTIKSQFLANMSHEIRTPMNAVIGMTDLLMRTSLNREQTEFANMIRDSASSLLDIINDILDFSKIEAGKLRLELGDFSLVSVIEGAAELLADRAREKGLCFVTFIDPAIPRRLRGDSGRLKQIIVNLIGNAVKFTDSGEIAVDASLQKIEEGVATVRIEVRDTGIGMSRDTLEQIFEPFTQADNSVARKYGGTGLGLSICSRLAELMGAVITVDSDPGVGSIFSFSVALEIGDVNKEPVLPLLSDVRLLVLTERDAVAALIRAYAEAWGITCRAVKTSQQALGFMNEYNDRNEPFAACIVELCASGADFVSEVFENPKYSGTNLIALNTTGARHNTGGQTPHGCVAYLSSPVRQSMLYECIATAVGRAPAASLRTTDRSEQGGTANLAALILIAEDNPVNQKVALLQLRQLGYEAHAVVNGADAVQALKRLPYALVLMDCQMPVMDGFQATREIRKAEMLTGRHVPIVAMTAHAMEGDRERCLAEGMDDYISKPVSAAELQEVLSRWLPKQAELSAVDSGL